MTRLPCRAMICALVAAAAVQTGCGVSASGVSSNGGDPSAYPLVSGPASIEHHAVTAADGSVSYRPAPPTTYETQPTPTCQRAIVQTGTGSAELAIPPTPGLRAVALSPHETRVTWWFDEIPDDCRPSLLLVSVVANEDPGATPMTLRLPFSGRSGSTVIRYGDFTDPADVALISATLANGLRSGVASVLIRQS